MHESTDITSPSYKSQLNSSAKNEQIDKLSTALTASEDADTTAALILANVLSQKHDKTPTTAMSSSIASVLDDSTPSDSGVQLLDSVSSGMNESFMSNCGLDLDGSNNLIAPSIHDIDMIPTTALATAAVTPIGLQCVAPPSSSRPYARFIDEINEATVASILPDVVMAAAHEIQIDEIAMTKSDIDNSNVDAGFLLGERSIAHDIPDEMKTSTCSTFDTDVIVFRRKVKKSRTSSTSSTGGSVKKRVSFHEDILKNTKTDNIHIEHGFITYKGYSKKTPHRFLRNSWCSQGNCEDYGDDSTSTGTCYRNACSDVLDYGKTDLYDHDSDVIQFDNSGVFEYVPRAEASLSPVASRQQIKRAASNDDGDRRPLYTCKCSDSNSSLESDDGRNGNANDVKRDDYARTKSSSCECIGQTNHLNNNRDDDDSDEKNISDNCYFSEPSIETVYDDSFECVSPKSVWRKEMKPKNSCLKKNRRETGVIQEQDLTKKVKTFNVHQLRDVNQLFGSLKNIFAMPLPERGVPEGCEDLQTVYECLPDADTYSPVTKRPSIEVTIEDKVQLPPIVVVEKVIKRKPQLSLFPIPPEDEMVHVAIADDTTNVEPTTKPTPAIRPTTFRNKFIINCESTVFEHTGVFCDNNSSVGDDIPEFPSASSVCITPQKTQPTKSSFMSFSPFKQRITNMFQSFRDSGSSRSSDTTTAACTPSPSKAAEAQRLQQEQLQAKLKKLQEEQQMKLPWNSNESRTSNPANYPATETDSFGASSMTSSIISCGSDRHSIASSSTTVTSSTTNTMSGPPHPQDRYDKYSSLKPPIPPSSASNSKSSSPNKKTRHLASPLRRKSATSKFDRSKLSPDLFCGHKSTPATNPMVLLSEEFDDLLTITTTTTSGPDADIIDNEIEVIDYSTVDEIPKQTELPRAEPLLNNFLRPSSSKSSLINRFLRNVTQKKINDATIKKNTILSAKYRDPPKLFSNLYVKTAKSMDLDSATADLNAEIALEMETNSGRDQHLASATVANGIQLAEDYAVGVGEIGVDLFDVTNLHFLRDDKEILMKVFKLYTGYNLHGHMTPVLVFLTDKTIYVTDLVRNRLCNKYVLPYTELDVILIGPHGNTVLLSNSARDMQQVLLAGGPYPADGLVSSLELCARRAGATLPAIGQLTLDHLAPLQKFVKENSSVSKTDAWIYYAVVSVPANTLTHEDEPLGPNMKGPLMHRSISFASDQHQPWMPGYFLLKAGVLYLFADANKKLPSMVIALTECKGARRAVQSTRPHCFEILMKTGTLQLAAPDEYVASEWLQTLVQSASGLFELQERHKTLGCTLVITSNHMITLREDFTSPLRRLNSTGVSSTTAQRLAPGPSREFNMRKLSVSTTSDVFNETCSNLSTPTKMSGDLLSSTRSSPSRSNSIAITHNSNDERSFSSISSIYGKNSGLEVKTCATLQEMITVRIPAHSDQWWCIVEFSCQEVCESSDDMVIFFATNSDMRRFLSILETMWHSKNNSPFPLSILPEDDVISSHGTLLFNSLNKSWEPLLSAALGYPQ